MEPPTCCIPDTMLKKQAELKMDIRIINDKILACRSTIGVLFQV